jgi:hypothetical protein
MKGSEGGISAGALCNLPHPATMPTQEQFDSLRKKVERELSDLTTFSPCPKPENEMFAVDLKHGGKIIVLRCDRVNLVLVSQAHEIPGNNFEVSAECAPGKAWNHVKLSRLGFLNTNGEYSFIEGQAMIQESVTKEGWKHRSTCYDFTFPNCERTFAVIKHLASAI